jgi:thiol-disulfide isomerase/thioredoxin
MKNEKMKRFLKKRNRAPLACLLAALLACLLAGCGAAANSGAKPDDGADAAARETPAAEAEIGIEIGRVAPNFTLDLRGGGTVTLWELRGKPVFLNVGATWCPPCQKELPDIQKAYELYGADVHFIGVDIGEEVSDVDDYFDGLACTYPIAFDPSGSIGADYGLDFIPLTWVLDADGVVTDYIAGGATFETFGDAIEKALKR